MADRIELEMFDGTQLAGKAAQRPRKQEVGQKHCGGSREQSHGANDNENTLRAPIDLSSEDGAGD